MLLAPALGAPPREIAERLGAKLTERLGRRGRPCRGRRARVPERLPRRRVVRRAPRSEIVARGRRAGGAARREHAEKVNVEYVSANPTGPLTAASARHAAYGDALARMLELAGHAVSREYYFNNAGSQVQQLGASVRARARNEPVPEDGYQGDYVAELAEQIPGAADLDDADARRGRVAADHGGHPRDAARLPGRLRHLLPRGLAARGRSRRRSRSPTSGCASWGTCTSPRARCGCAPATFGDDKDRVLQRSTGAPTYFAADVAYHEDKFRRGFDRADRRARRRPSRLHRAAEGRDRVDARRGGRPRVEMPILQFVHVVEGGEKAKMSKRRGDFVTLDELIAAIGVDATRWFMLSRSHESTIDLDLELAAKQDPENPVYYVQTMHARIAGDLAQAEPGRLERALAAAPGAIALNAPSASWSARCSRSRARCRGGRSARAAPDRRLRARARSGVRRVLPRLAGAARSPTRHADASASRSASRPNEHSRPPWAARRLGPGGHVMLDASSSRSAVPAPVHPRRQPRPDPLQRAALRVRPGVAAAHGARRRSTIIADEGRATRSQARTSSAATVDGGEVVLYAGTQDDLAVGERSPARTSRAARGDRPR